MNIQLATKAILHVYPNAQFIFRGVEYENFDWLSETIQKPTEEEIEELIEELINEPKPLLPDWGKLLTSLTGSPYFLKGYQASKKTLAANTAFTLLMTTITSTKNLETFAFSFQDLMSAMKSSSQIEEYTTEDLQEIAVILTDCNFNPELIIGAINNV